MDALKHRVHTAYKTAAEMVLPVRASSGFAEQGVLTPEEFVVAGDFLVRTCPTWSWDAGKGTKAKSYLPKEKQFLVTRNVPCLKRADSGDGTSIPEELLAVDGDDDAWVAPQSQVSEEDKEELQEIGEPVPQPAATMESAGEEEDVPDMDDFEDDNIDDPAALDTASLSQQLQEKCEVDNVLRTRTYDISITYDKYYQVPRIWLIGYDETRQPLEPVKCLEDVSHEHARKTVTIDEHPHLPIMSASIHPCKHANVMKRISDMMIDGGKTPTVEHYLFLFLKFIASIVPTIEYDYTVAVGTVGAGGPTKDESFDDAVVL